MSALAKTLAPLTVQFHRWLRQQGIRPTPARDAVTEHLAARSGHPTLQELSDDLAAVVSSITVYRTLRQLEEAGLVERFEIDGIDRYEVSGDHHDHIVCIGCGRVEEFHSPAIEARQQQIARAHGFEAIGHLHLLHGRCARCRGDG